ncbi:MAG: HD domain-containing protein [Planctomycetaceae bacterium]|nr:HD domain-containing protein [Planctomycetaceae bacterium]
MDLFESVFFAPDFVERPFEEAFDALSFTDDELNAYLTMVVLSIDFRSSQTVTHTVTATTVASALAELMGMPPEEADRVYLGTMLHDLGKQGIPPEILEAPGKLSPKAMEIMRSHVGMMEDILDGNVDEGVFNIAVHHHEKLDGSGYPRGIKGEYLGMAERLATVADILSALVGVRSYKESFPKDKVTAILADMADQGEVDPEIVQIACEHYEYVMNKVTKTAGRIVGIYNHMNLEFDHFKEQSVRYGKDESLGFVLE